MAKPWFRLHRKILNNRKVRSLKPELFQAWVFLLCCADDDGSLKDLADVAFEMRVTEERAQQLIDALIAAGMFDRDANGQVTARDWTEHNPPSDGVDPTNADRQRRYKERRNAEKTGQPNASGNAGNGDGNGVTPVTVTALDTDTDTDKKKTDLDARAREGVFFEDDGFEKFWSAYPKRPTDPESAAEVAWAAAIKAPGFPGVDAIVAALGRWKYARSLEASPGNTPFAKVWLAEKRWLDWPEPPPPEPHKRDWAEAYPETWGRLKTATTPNEWAFWLGKCTVNGPPHVLYAPDKFTREKVEQKYGTQIAAMFGGKGTVRVLGEIHQGAAA